MTESNFITKNFAAVLLASVQESELAGRLVTIDAPPVLKTRSIREQFEAAQSITGQQGNIKTIGGFTASGARDKNISGRVTPQQTGSKPSGTDKA